MVIHNNNNIITIIIHQKKIVGTGIKDSSSNKIIVSKKCNDTTWLDSVHTCMSTADSDHSTKYNTHILIWLISEKAL